jgi:hypothetical protein
MNAVQVAITVLKLVPTLIEIIKAIEAAIPASGKGADKMEAVKNILAGTVEGFETFWPAISNVINTLVDLFNKTGVFKK